MAKKSVFISFDADQDKQYKNLLLAWDKNSSFDFSFYDGSLRGAIDSTNAAYIKSKIRPLIAAASRLLCIVGKETYKSEWVEWEINTAVVKRKKLIAVKVSKDCTSPAAILGHDAEWALSFNLDAIKKAIDSS